MRRFLMRMPMFLPLLAGLACDQADLGTIEPEGYAVRCGCECSNSIGSFEYSPTELACVRDASEISERCDAVCTVNREIEESVCISTSHTPVDRPGCGYVYAELVASQPPEALHGAVVPALSFVRVVVDGEGSGVTHPTGDVWLDLQGCGPGEICPVVFTDALIQAPDFTVAGHAVTDFRLANNGTLAGTLFPDGTFIFDSGGMISADGHVAGAFVAGIGRGGEELAGRFEPTAHAPEHAIFDGVFVSGKVSFEVHLYIVFGGSSGGGSAPPLAPAPITSFGGKYLATVAAPPLPGSAEWLWGGKLLTRGETLYAPIGAKGIDMRWTSPDGRQWLAPVCLTADPHGVCSVGDALAGSCDSCAQLVCELQPSCCDTAWTQACVTTASTYCDSACK